MKIAILSDTHWHSNKMVAGYKGSDQAMAAKLRNLSVENDYVILAGDIFELWQSRWISKKSMKAEMYRIRKAMPLTMSIFEQASNLIYIKGNHDRVATGFPEVGFNDTIVSHGAGDLNRFMGIEIFFCWLVGWIERLMPTKRNYFSRFVSWISNVLGYKNKDQIKIARKRSCKAFICGHTHKAQMIRFLDGTLYLNTGYYDEGHENVIKLDTETYEVISEIKLQDYSEVKKILKKGDIILSGGRSILSETIKTTTDSPYSHTMIYVGNGRIIEAIDKGVVLGTIDKYLQGDHDIIIRRLYDRSKMKKFIKSLYSDLGKKYSFWQNVIDLFYVGVYKWAGVDFRKEISIDAEKDKFNCSELAATHIKKIYGYGIEPATYYPGDFVKANYCYTVAVK